MPTFVEIIFILLALSSSTSRSIQLVHPTTARLLFGCVLSLLIVLVASFLLVAAGKVLYKIHDDSEFICVIIELVIEAFESKELD